MKDRYLYDFDYKTSRANGLFSKTEYSYPQIVSIVRHISQNEGLELNRFILRSKACCYKFIEINFPVFLAYSDSIIKEKLCEKEARMDLSHDQRYALVLEMYTIPEKPFPEGADVEPLVLSKFLVDNESFRYLTDQIGG